MAIREYKITLTGKMPILMHADNVTWADGLDRWRRAAENQSEKRAGDDRQPAWTWIGYVYHDDEHVGIPQENILASFRDGGAKVPMKTGRGTYKKQTQSGILIPDPIWPLMVSGKPIRWPDVEALRDEDDFERHLGRTEDLGFSLLVKRAAVGAAKHIRVRPKFWPWVVSGTVVITDDSLTEGVLQQIIDYAGRYGGILDWRPGSKKSPGPYGVYEGAVEKVR